jgi:peroxisome-assembly ATPase
MVNVCSNFLQVRSLIFVPSDPLTPLRQYQKLIESGVLRGDEYQTRIIQKLQELHDKLSKYDPPMIPYSSSENSLVSQFDLFFFP